MAVDDMEIITRLDAADDIDGNEGLTLELDGKVIALVLG